MDYIDVKEEKKPAIKGQDDKRRIAMNKSFKSKIEQFMETLEEIANYIQIKYNSGMAKMISKVEWPVFKFLKEREACLVMTKDAGFNSHKTLLINFQKAGH